MKTLVLSLNTSHCGEPATFGEFIRKARLEKVLTQKELACPVGIDEMTTVNWERYETVPRRRHGVVRSSFDRQLALAASVSAPRVSLEALSLDGETGESHSIPATRACSIGGTRLVRDSADARDGQAPALTWESHRLPAGIAARSPAG